MGISIEEKAIKTLNEIIDEGWLISDMEKCTAIDACEFAIDRIHELPPPMLSEMVSTIPCGIVRHVHCATTPLGKTLRHTLNVV